MTASRLAHIVFGLAATGACEPALPASAPSSEPQSAPVANADEARVRNVINAERAARDLPPAGFVDEPRPLTTAAEMIRQGSPPDVALRTALGRLVEAESSEGRGWCVPTESLAELQFPSVVVEAETLTLGLVVVRMEGAAASAGAATPYVVCYLVIEDGQDYQGK